MTGDSGGFYSLAQLCSRGETELQKAREGRFPWSRTKILGMVKRGEFPEPIRGVGQKSLWPKDAIHAFEAKIMQEGRM